MTFNKFSFSLFLQKSSLQPSGNPAADRASSFHTTINHTEIKTAVSPAAQLRGSPRFQWWRLNKDTTQINLRVRHSGDVQVTCEQRQQQHDLHDEARVTRWSSPTRLNSCWQAASHHSCTLQKMILKPQKQGGGAPDTVFTQTVNPVIRLQIISFTVQRFVDV